VLLVLAVAAGEGIAILPASRYGMAREHSPPPGGQSADIPPPAASSAIGASHQGVFELDFAGDVLQLSREAAGLLGSPGGALTLPHGVWMDRIHPDDQAVYRAAIHDYRGHPGTAFRVEFRVRSEGGRFPWMELRATMMGEGASADRCLGLMADVTARKDAEAAVMDRTIRDPLTGLGNRVGLMETLERYDGHLADTTFAVLDIDRFKSVHTSLGDAGADAVLSGLARRIFKKFEGSAAVFRVGGDAFAVLMGTAGHDAGAIGADLIEACKPPFEQNGRNIFVSASVGIAAGTDARDALDLLKNAELALIQAKRQGGARACIYASTMESLAPGDAVALEADLRQALRDNQLDVYYQPIMRLGDGTIAGFEALVRWLHPEKGPIEPSEFVPHCEETGLIVAIGRLALERAVTDVSQWQRYFPLDPPLFVSVNLSRRQLFDDELESVLKDVLAKNGPVSGTVQLEVTETAIAHSDDAKAILSRLRSAGVGLAIDDFGTGTANFQQLKDLPFDTVKVDRSFLAQRSGKSEARGGGVILSSIVNLAHDLHRDVVVEGVESEDEAVWLRALGCEYGQGFHFGAPMPREGVLEFISRHYRVDTAQA